MPLPRLRLVRPSFPVGAELPRNGDDAEHGGSGDERVGTPVGRLGVPTTRRRPDVLGVTVSDFPRSGQGVSRGLLSWVRRGQLTGFFHRHPREWLASHNLPEINDAVAYHFENVSKDVCVQSFGAQLLRITGQSAIKQAQESRSW